MLTCFISLSKPTSVSVLTSKVQKLNYLWQVLAFLDNFWVVVDSCGWFFGCLWVVFWIAVGGCEWLWVVEDSWGWLWVEVDGCGWFCMVADSCVWLWIVAFFSTTRLKII